jgi:hypothetical protein
MKELVFSVSVSSSLWSKIVCVLYFHQSVCSSIMKEVVFSLSVYVWSKIVCVSYIMWRTSTDESLFVVYIRMVLFCRMFDSRALFFVTTKMNKCAGNINLSGSSRLLLSEYTCLHQITSWQCMTEAYACGDGLFVCE